MLVQQVKLIQNDTHAHIAELPTTILKTAIYAPVSDPNSSNDCSIKVFC